MFWNDLFQLVFAISSVFSMGDAVPTQAERIVLQETNAYRARSGLPPLTLDARLMKAARSHAATMANTRVMSHNFRGSTPAGRANYFGYLGGVRENIANGYGPEDVVGVAWMNSPPHRANLLSHSATIGVGMVWANNRWWACQVLGN